MKSRTFLAAIFVAATTLAINAQEPVKQNREDVRGNRPAFVDENNNGICDHYENGTCPNGNKPMMRQGRRGFKQGQPGDSTLQRGRAMCPGMKRGMGTGMYQGKGRMQGFKDDNKNGICDYYEEWLKNNPQQESKDVK